MARRYIAPHIIKWPLFLIIYLCYKVQLVPHTVGGRQGFSMYPGCPETHSVDHGGLKLKRFTCRCLPSAGVKHICVNTAQPKEVSFHSFVYKCWMCLGGVGWTHSLGDQERCLDSSSIALYLSLWKDVSLNLESIVIWLGWLGSKFQQPTCSPKCWGCGQVPRHLDFYVGAGECFHACRVGVHYTHTQPPL